VWMADPKPSKNGGAKATGERLVAGYLKEELLPHANRIIYVPTCGPLGDVAPTILGHLLQSRQRAHVLDKSLWRLGHNEM
jgi:hypothetical protein